MHPGPLLFWGDLHGLQPDHIDSSAHCDAEGF